MTVCLINISFIDRLLSQGRAVFFCLGIMLSTHIAKTIKSRTQRNHCDKVTNGQHRHISPFPDFPFGIDLCNRSYVLLSVQSEPPSTRQRVVAPKNILTK